MIDANQTSRSSQWPAVRQVTMNDLIEAVGEGVRDLRRAPSHSLALGAIYVIGGWMLIALLMVFDLPYLVYPLAAGFALIAPFVATSFYAISHGLAAGESVSWAVIRQSVRRATRADLGWMALVTGFAFFIWLDIAAVLFFGFMGLNVGSFETFLRDVFTTTNGLMFLIIGNAAGAVIALIVFSISVISFPMLFERDCDFVTAMVTSVRVVLANKPVMVAWCATIAALVGLSLLSGLVGLLVVLPVLGHASWHLYFRCVVPVGEG